MSLVTPALTESFVRCCARRQRVETERAEDQRDAADKKRVATVRKMKQLEQELHSLRIFKPKFKEGQVDRVQDARTVICKGLFKPGTDMNLFLGMQGQLGEDGPMGVIESTFGKTKFKCRFPHFEGGMVKLQEACQRARLILKYRRFVFDPQKRMIQ